MFTKSTLHSAYKAILPVFLILLFNNCGKGFQAIQFANNSSVSQSTPTPVPPTPTPTPRTPTPTPVPPTPTPTPRTPTPTPVPPTPTPTPRTPTPTPVPPTPTPVQTPTPVPSPIDPNAPAYISSMAPFQVRAMTGAYAPSNGTTTFRSIMPSMWSGNDDIMRPWSGGTKATSGSRVWVHGGGHGDSSNNSLSYFDFAGTNRPTGWVLASAGQTGSSAGGTPVGSIGFPVSVHTYDGMCEINGMIYRLGGSTYPTGGFTAELWRFDTDSAVWRRFSDYPGRWFAGMVVCDEASGKILAMERWATYFTYAFYNVATNSWGALKQVRNQYPNDSVAAYNTRTNTAVYSSNGLSFSSNISWSAETISQTAQSMGSISSGSATVYDPVTDRYWYWGGTSSDNILYEVNPTTYAVTPHQLTGDTIVTESGGHGIFGRFVFIESWRAIGFITGRTTPAYVIRLP